MIRSELTYEIRQILEQARQKAYAAVNSSMVLAYWRIGKRIVEEEQGGERRAAYGEELLKTLSVELSQDFGPGFSYANLRNFRQFYLTYPDHENCYTLCSKLSWSHHRQIMRVDDAAARAYYLKECSDQNWSTRTLERNIGTLYYQRILSTQHPASGEQRLTEQPSDNVRDFVKDPFVFEFLKITQESRSTEKEIETALIDNMQLFILELGKGFSFVGRQYRISTETDHFFIDLVFYNYLLKCFVLMDLKIDKLTHQDIGQMDMYRRLFDDLKKPEGDNPTIGIILCTDKSETMVKYSVMNENPTLFASRYRPFLPTEDELRAEIEREKSILAQRMIGEVK